MMIVMMYMEVTASSMRMTRMMMVPVIEVREGED